MDNKTTFRADAKQMVDSLFDAGLFKEHLTRDEMKALEDWIELTLTSKFESSKRIDALMERINDRKQMEKIISETKNE